MPRANDQIGPYQLIKKLGRGGFGEVWLAKNVTAFVAREVALKIPHDEDVDLNAIKQEAEIWLAASGHPNVLPFIEANVYEDYVAIVSEYAPDGSLRDWLKQHGGRAPSIEAAIEMTRGILHGLAHLHARNIIHRDLKPDNVLLQGTTPRITDFGVSRVFKSTSHSAVSAGTPVYMAPEAFDARRNQQTDVWSVGVMLYQMLAGRLPFSGESYGEIMFAVIQKEAHPMPSAIPDWLQKIAFKAMAKRPVERYKTAAEMLLALQDSALVLPLKAVESVQRQKREIIQIPLVEVPSKPRPVQTKSTPNDDINSARFVLPKPYIENLNGVPLEMILVQAGKFIMGSNKYDAEKPRHKVQVRSFFIGKYQITQKQWITLMDKNPSYFKGDDLPVENISWHDAQVFCEKLRAMTGKAYRLPTEAEWEFACRAETTGDYAARLDDVAWYWKYNGTSPVGQKKTNAFGVYDMHGNVWEWCEDIWHDNYNDAPTDGSAWMSGGDVRRRVVRGGSWGLNEIVCRSAYRLKIKPNGRDGSIGLRVAVSVKTS